MARGVAGYGWDAFWEDYRRAVAEHALTALKWRLAGLPEIFWRELYVGPALRAFRELGCDEVLG